MLYSCADGNGLSSNSVTIEYWDSSNEEDKIPALVTAAITLCFMLVGLPSNLVIIVAILWKHLYRQPTYILLLNLAIVDLSSCNACCCHLKLHGGHYKSNKYNHK